MLFPTLSESIPKICARDSTLVELKFTLDCLKTLEDFIPNEDFDEERSYDGLDPISRENYNVLASEFAGSREWYCKLAVMIGVLKRLRAIAFESLDPNERTLERFWGEYAASKSLRLVICIDMDLTKTEEIFTMFSAPNVKAVEFERCIIGVCLGHILGDSVRDDNKGLARELTFTDCNFPDVKSKEDRMECAGGLLNIPGLKSIKFKGCHSVDLESLRKFFNLLDGSSDDVVIVIED